MAAKSKKVAEKKAPAKKALKKKKPARKAVVVRVKAEKVDVEVVPDLMHPEVTKQIAQVEGVIEGMEGVSDRRLIERIESCATQAAKFSGQALQAGASALVYAWACGKLLNAAKQRLGHGAFGNWRREHIEGKYMSARTSMRYMKLAERCNDVRALLQWAPTLKQAYVECGILPAPPERDHDGADEDDAEGDLIRKKKALLSGVSQLQQRMQQCVSVKGHLDADDRRQLKLAKHAIDAFFTQILG